MNKKKIIATASAVALAAVLAFGGTLTYLNGTSVTATNEVDPDFNWVSLTETDTPVENGITKDDDGNITNTGYEIIPGTSQAKDPTVNVSYSVDSYVYVKVTDTSGGLITWTPADGWTLLSSTTDSDGIVTDVYYRLVDGTEDNAEKQDPVNNVTYYKNSFSVLKDDSISYSSSITNANVVDEFDEDGDPTFKNTNIKLTFQAYIIQAQLDGTTGENYATPAEAYAVALGAPYVSGASYEFLEADDETSIQEALADAVSRANENEEGTTVIVLPEADEDTEDVELGSKLSVTGDMVIDLNGNNLTLDGDASDTRVVEASEGATLTLTNGSVDTDKSYGVTAYSGSSVSLENMDVSAATYALYVDDANLEATDCTLTADNSRAVLVTTYYEYQENSESTASCEVTLTNCKITATGSNYAAGVQSQGANITLTIDSCDITSNYYGVYQNGAYSPVTIKIVNTTIADKGSGGVYVSNSSTSGREKQTLIIENSTITGPTAVEFKHTNATITDSTLNATVDPATSGENGNGSCTNGYSLACTTNGASDYVTGTVVVTDCDMYLVQDGKTSEGHYFVYQVADGNSVTINGTAVSNCDSYGDGAAAD